MLCVYILENLTGTAKTYVGFTVDLKRRLRKHNREIAGGAKATEGRLWKPFLIITGFHTKRCGLQLEWRVKHPPRTWSQPRSITSPGGSSRHRRRRKNHSKSIIFPKSLFPQAKPSNIYKDDFVKISCAKLPKKFYLAHAVCAILHLDRWTKNAIPLIDQGEIVLHWDEINDLEFIKAPWPDHVQHRQFDWANFEPQSSVKAKNNSIKADEFISSIDQNGGTQSDEKQPNEIDESSVCPDAPTSSHIDSFVSPVADSSISREILCNHEFSQLTTDPSPRVKSKNLVSEIEQSFSIVELSSLRRSPRIKRMNETSLN